MARSNASRAAHIQAESVAIEHTQMLLETIRYDRAEADRHLRVAQQRADHLAIQQNQLEARLLSMKQTLLALRADYMQDSLNSCPDDILRCIFHEAVELPSDDWRTFGFGCYDDNHATIPFALASVYSRWRRVALHSPKLWTNIAIPGPPLTVADLNRIDLLLERSSPCTIDILLDIQWRNYEPSDQNDPLHRCVAALSQNSARWRRVQVWLIEKASIDILNVLRGPLPLLAELSLTISLNDLEGGTRTQKTLLPFAPRLQKLDLAFAGFDIADSNHPGFSSLHYLRCWNDLGKEQEARLLSISKTTLQYLDLCTNEASENIPPFPLAMPNLQSLSLQGTPFFAQWPLSGLLLPRLTSLALRSTLISAELEPFLELVSPTVTHLELFGKVRATILDLIKILSNVTHLEIVRRLPDGGSSVDDDFFVELTDAIPCIWPKLTVVRFDNSVTVDPSGEEGILRLVNRRTLARTQQEAALREVEVNYHCAPAWLVAEVARLLSATKSHERDRLN